MDSAIKNGGYTENLLLGYGQDKTGLQGLWDVELAKEKGISDPKNIQTVLNRANQLVGNNPTARRMMIAQGLGLTESQYLTLEGSGVLDKLKKGTAVNQQSIDDLKSNGESDLAKQLEKYNSSMNGTVNKNQAKSEQTNTGLAEIPKRISEGIKSIYNMQPTGVRDIEKTAMGIGLGTLVSSGAKSLLTNIFKKVTPNLGKTMAVS